MILADSSSFIDLQSAFLPATSFQLHESSSDLTCQTKGESASNASRSDT
jgi:hypothetical protein